MRNNKAKSTKNIKAKLIVWCISSIGLLPLSLARTLGSIVGHASWMLNTRGCQVTRTNISLCYPNMERQRQRSLAKQSVIETGRLAAEVCVIQRRGKAWLDKHIINIVGEELIENEIANKRGIIFLAPHIGNWEVLGLTLPRYGNMMALYQPPKQAYLEEFIVGARQKTGATLVPTTARGIAKLLKSIKTGGITAVLPDQTPKTGSGEFSTFFGLPAYTMTLIHGLTERSNCRVIYGLAKRVTGGFEIHYFPASEDIYSDDRERALTALNRGVEQCITYSPEQYQWEYKRFKKTPDGKDPYKRSQQTR